MNKRIKLVIAGLVALSFGMVSVATVSSPALAKTKAAKVISHQKLAKTKVHPNGGSLYTSTKLTKKSPKTFRTVKTTFYATKSVKLKKANGKRATYYYVKNKKGNINGWIWKGYLNKTSDLAQRASDIRRFKGAYSLLEKRGDMRSLTDKALREMTLAHAYNISDHVNKAGIASLLTGFYAWNPKEAKASLAAYNIFKGRFNAKTNAKLLKQKKAVLKAISEYKSDGFDSDDDLWDATNELGLTLAKAVHTLD